MNEDSETAGVVVPPPVIFGGLLALGLLLGRGTPSDTRVAAFASGVGTAPIDAGVLLGALTIAKLKSLGTNANPFAPAAALATDGPFRYTRNPAYVGATSLYIGIALRARSLPALVLLPVALALLDRLVVDPEERYLARRFGEAYRTYYDATPRWF
jgi:protein-S-isoprenylcysteine O-methyltransferase Ste14